MDIHIVEHEGIHVVRDDLVPGGTKSRFVGPLIASRPESKIFYPGNTYGIAMLAIAIGTQDIQKDITIFLIADELDQNNPILRAAKAAANPHVHFVPVELPDYRALVAHVYAHADAQTYVVPPGFNTPEVVNGIESLGKEILNQYGLFDVFYSVYGSGTIQRGIQHSGLAKQYIAVDTLYEDSTGRDPGIAQTILHYKEQPLMAPALLLPPYPSFPAYDAKAWGYALKEKKAHPEKRILLWNVGACPE